MSRYSIRDLEQLSGIKAHTIRMWEQRHQLISPKRTQTNIRYYDDQDLKLILNVALLNANGFKISKIAGMSQPEIQNEVLNLTSQKENYEDQLHALTIAMVDLNEIGFERILSSNILKLGFEKTMLKIIYPFLSKIGILWQTGAINPAQEHFVSNLIRQKLIVAIDSQYVQPDEKSCKYILFLPEGELHELGLLFSDLIVRSRKNQSLYLGQSLPLKDVVAIYKQYQPDFIITVVTSVPGPADIQNFLNILSQSFPEAITLISGQQVIGQDLIIPSNIIQVNQPKDLISVVENQHEHLSI